jgi:hypothetical protein
VNWGLLASGFHWVCEKKSWGVLLWGRRGEKRERKEKRRELLLLLL